MNNRPDVLRAAAILATGLAILASAAPVATAAGNEVISIPIRWCVVEGTSAALNPQCASQPGTTQVLWMRGVFTSHFHSLPFCRLAWRSAAVIHNVPVPVIPDPCDPTSNPSCAGQKGDFIDGSFERIQAHLACSIAWNQIQAQLGLSDIGIIGINLRRFVDGGGNPLSVFGRGGIPGFADPNSQASFSGSFAVVDNDFILPQPYGQQAPPCLPEVGSPVPPWDGHESVVGHEAGHAVSLQHQPGTLMNLSAPMPEILTTGGPGQNDIVCPNPLPVPVSQCGQMRLQGMCAVSGTTVDPPPIVDEMPLVIGDAAPAHVDLHMVGVTDDAATARASFFWQTGLFATAEAGAGYCFAADRDNDPATGGDPAALGVDIALPGADLVGCVTVDAGPPGPGRLFVAAPSLWEHAGGGFVARPSLAARADELLESGPNGETPVITVTSLTFDRSLLATGGGPVPESFAVAALARRAAGPETEQVAPGRTSLRRPLLPECRVSPAAARRGDEVEVQAEGLAPGRTTRVLLGPDTVAAGTVAGDGSTVSRFVVGADTRSGWIGVSIGADDPDEAVTADCALVILPPPSGTVPDGGAQPGAPLLVQPAGAGDLTLSWEASCSPAAIDYAVYEGTIGAFTSHQPRLCSTGGATTATLTPAAGNTYYLVVPSNGEREGGYGVRSDGTPRPASAAACAPQDPGACP